MRHASGKWLLTAVLAFCLPWPAAGQTCGNVKQGEELKNPPEIPRQRAANNYVVATTLDVQEKSFCIPNKDNGDGTWTTAPMALRTFVYPDPMTKLPTWGLPGPTLRLRKSGVGERGDALEILLKNSLTFPTSHDCNSTCDASTACDCANPDFLKTLIPKCTSGGNPPAECCCVYNCTQQTPNCQHGDNVTNLHFHGSHVSPQEPQDFVLLDLYPPKPAGAPASMGHMASAHGAAGKVAFGEYQYAIPWFGLEQPEGTHWYHPHRHGSTSLQVGNGLAGALLIEGAFDDWLKQYYTTEKVLVAQAITNDSRLGAPAGQVLINGQIKPKITAKPGEIQRWRIINATMNSRTLLRITMPAGLIFRQISMDGVQFSPINYECQPLLGFDSSTPSFPCDPNPPSGKPTTNLAPGNRIDFLVQVPMTETRKGTEGLRIGGAMLDLQAGERGQQRRALWNRHETLAAEAPDEVLFTISIDDGIEGNDDQPKKLAAGAPAALPTAAVWPPMPPYLATIKDSELDGTDVNMTFQQFLVNSETQQWPYAGAPLSTFKIDDRQFKSDCANVTTTLGKAKQWNVSNATLLRHPFHIHTNPIQVFSVKGVPVQAPGQTKPEPFWLDTLMLPTATVDPALPPDLTQPFEIKIDQAAFVSRQRYTEFTGAYVLHCHILGHEDRGMMLSVQTVCGDGGRSEAKGKFGHTTSDPNGECVAGAPYFGPLPACQ